MLVVILAFACADKVTEPRDSFTEQTGGPQRIICEGSDCCILHPGSCGPGGEDDGDDGPEVEVVCDPNPVIRADTIVCTATVSPATKPYILVRWLATGEDGRTWNLPLGEPKSAGEASTWAGPAVLSTEVSVFVSVEDDEGNEAELSSTTDYTVEPREWTLTIENRPRIKEVGLPLTYPPENTGSLHGAFARVDLWPHDSKPQVGEIVGGGTGPNLAWWYIRDPLPRTDPVVLINKALNPKDPFYQAQDKHRKPGGGCTQQDLDSIRIHALEHEGAIPGRLSHYDVWVQELPAHNLGDNLEMLHAHIPTVTRTQFYELVKQTRLDWEGYMNARQSVVDQDKLQVACTFHAHEK